jgi:peptide/nickel transport system permease protein
MAAYLVRRFGLMLLTLFGISVVIFLMLRVAPGNIADVLFDAAGLVDPAQKASLERDLGLSRSLTRFSSRSPIQSSPSSASPCCR